MEGSPDRELIALKGKGMDIFCDSTGVVAGKDAEVCEGDVWRVDMGFLYIEKVEVSVTRCGVWVGKHGQLHVVRIWEQDLFLLQGVS